MSYAHPAATSSQNPGSEIITGYPSTMGDDVQLNTTTLIRHAARTHGEREIVYRNDAEQWQRYTIADCYERVCRIADGMRSLGIGPGDRVGVLAWNSHRHFELYWAIPGIGAVMTMLNLRLGPTDLGYVLEDSGAETIFVEESLLPIAQALAPDHPRVKNWVIISDTPLSEIETTLPDPQHYETLVENGDPTPRWQQIDERSAYGACYTTGTTGRPKGVYYSHRSIVLHAAGLALSLAFTLDDCVMFITPMFHAQSWGMPQAAMLMACKMVLPGRYQATDTDFLVDALVDEGVTVTSGAPAIFQPMLDRLRERGERPDFSRLRALSGGSEPPVSLMRGLFDETGAEIIQGYGATETSPVATLNLFKPSMAEWSEEERWDNKRKQGLMLPLVDFRLVLPDGSEAPHDGVTAGEIQMRGPWITSSYHNVPVSFDQFEDGWWRSGDMGTIDPNGYIKLTDRLKDVIKSGGEWISSIDMENALMAHPKIREAAVIGVPDPKWEERPVAIVALVEGATLEFDEIKQHLSAKFATWQMPDRIEIVDEVPRTSVGKWDKKRMRAEYGGQA